MSDKYIQLVSVIIPTRNRMLLLSRAIESVVNQTWKNIQLIVVNDASNDNTLDFLKEIRPSVSSFSVVTNENAQGGAKSRNIGIQNANGDYIAFLDDDDVWLPEKIEKQIKAFNETNNCSAVTCSYLHKSSWFYDRVFNTTVPINMQQLLRYNSLGGTSLLFTSKVKLNEVIGFDQSLQSSQDWDLWLRLFQKGEIANIQLPLAIYESHNGYRISTNMRSVYIGRKSLYIKYKNVMDKNTRKINIAAILFARLHIDKHNLIYTIRQLYKIIKIAGIQNGKKYIYWSAILFVKKFKHAK